MVEMVSRVHECERCDSSVTTCGLCRGFEGISQLWSCGMGTGLYGNVPPSPITPVGAPSLT